MEFPTQRKSMILTIAEYLYNKISTQHVLLVVLIFLLSSLGKNVVQSLRLMFMLLATQLHGSQEAQHSASFVLVNIMVLAIWIRSSSILTRSNSKPKKKLESTPLSLPLSSSVPESKIRRASRIQAELHQTWDSWEKEHHAETHSQKDRQIAGRLSFMGRRSAPYPLVCGDAIVEETRLVDPGSPSWKIATRQEEIVVYKDDLMERIESFIAKHRAQWRQQRQEDGISCISWTSNGPNCADQFYKLNSNYQTIGLF
ncbi:hypothetical protein O6H91_06G145800 [Diphasiastrum complanatum]|uniref:Uncharacterized protein n=2 Tax=Diphasiastrum complanatum TaxID=34168 RepID=A0ACC2DJY7_DIPCM|nr:hypothetical protein O6H91_06G145800 [Diphasiastrum complanatum]KAJ7554569.1 hypothetical protein O6H91_06G145800 [Diphasiastrum complanatum]